MPKIKTWDKDYKGRIDKIFSMFPIKLTLVGPIGDWDGHRTKISFVCSKHGEQIKTLKGILKKSGCKVCSGESRTGNTRRIPWEEVAEELKENLSAKNCSLVGLSGPYKGRLSRVICKCEKHGEWEASLASVLKLKTGCFACGRDLSLAIRHKENTWDRRYKAECEAAAGDNITVLGFIGPWAGITKTKVKAHCSIHGEFSSVSVDNFKRGQSCYDCGRLKTCDARRREWDEVKKSLPDRKAEGLTVLGFVEPWIGDRSYLIVDCKIHGEYTSCRVHNFRNMRGCPQCMGKNQKEAYISILGCADGWNNLKFGIARDSLRRVKEQQYKATSLEVKSAVIYSFPTVKQCRAAERAVFTQLADHVGSVPKSVMPDGYTETLPISFMNQVIEIYKEHGGKLKPVSLVRPKRKAVRNAG